MTSRYEVLKKAMEMAQHNMNAYGTHWGEEPKEGYEAEWQQAKEEKEILEAMLNELFKYCPEAGQRAHLYIGTINGYQTCPTWDKKGHYVSEVEIETKHPATSTQSGGQRFTFHMDKDTADEWILGKESRLDVERHQRYDEGKDTNLRIWVNDIGYIFRMEWETK